MSDMLNMEGKDNSILIYQDDNGVTKVNVRFADENPTVKNFFTVRQEGRRTMQRNIVHYNLDMIIA